MIGTLGQDIRYGIRMLLRTPGFTAVALTALALGIGANTAIFSVVNAVLLRPLPYKDSDRVVMVWENDTQEGNPKNAVSPGNFADFRDRNQALDQLEYYTQPTGMNLTSGDEPERIQITGVSAGLLSAVGIEPMLGRNFLPDEGQSGGGATAIVTYGFWQRSFGSDPSLVGKTLMLDGSGYSVVGILPQKFELPEKVDLLIPIKLTVQDETDRKQHFLRLIGHLKPGISLQQAQAAMTGIARQLEQQYPETNTGRGATVITIKDQLVGDVRSALIILLGAVAFVLLIACTNVANLLLARGAIRQKEMAIRTALGASRGRMIKQLLVESILLSLIGGTLGLLLAVWSFKLLMSLGPATLPHAEGDGISLLLLGFTLILSLLTGVIFSLLPALQVSKPNFNEILKEGGRGSTEGLRLNRIGRLLVISEISLSLVLLVGAGLMIKSFVRLQETDPGFNPKKLLTMQLTLPTTRYGNDQQLSSFYRQLNERIEALPGVVSVGIISRLPLAGDRSTTSLRIEGQLTQIGELPEVHYRIIAPSYFRTMGIPLLQGREFTDQDSQDSPMVIMINQSLAHTYWPNEAALDKRVKLGPREDSPWFSIVGVAGNARNFGLDADVKNEVYVSCIQGPTGRTRLVIRTASDPLGLVGAVKDQIHALDKDLPVSQINTMETLIAESVSQKRLNVFLLTIFAIMALILSMIGIYGVISYSVSQRMHEMGIRMALGAQPRDVFRLIVGQGARLALIGTAIGLAVAFALTRVLASLLYGVSTTDPMIFLSLSLLLLSMALLACYIPARRAMRADPMAALRHD